MNFLSKRPRFFFRALSLLLTVLALGGFCWLYYSQAGLQWLARRGAGLVPANLSIAPLHGSLAAGVRSGQVRYRDAGLSVTLSDISLRCHWWQLLNGALPCEALHLGQLTIEVAGGKSEAPAPGGGLNLNVALPFDWRVDRLTLDQLTITSTGSSNQFTDLSAAARWHQQRISWTELRGQWRELALHAARGKVELRGALAIDTSVTASGPHWSGQIRAHGDLTHLETALSVEQPQSISASGTLALLPDFSGSLALRWRQLDLAAYLGGQATLGAGSAQLDFHWPEFTLDGDAPLSSTYADTVLGVHAHTANLAAPLANADLALHFDGRSAALGARLAQAEALPFSGGFTLRARDGQFDGSSQALIIAGIAAAISAQGTPEHIDARVSAHAAHLQWRTLSGDAAALDAQLSYRDGQLDGNGEFRLGALALDDQPLAETLRLQLHSLRPLQATASVVRLSHAALSANTIQAELRGDLAEHRLALSAQLFGEQAVALSLQGGYADRQWRARDIDLNWQRTADTRYRIHSEALRVDAEQLELRASCLLVAAHSACVDGSLSRAATTLNATFAEFPLNAASDIFTLFGGPPGLAIDGSLSGNLALERDASQWQLTSALRVPSLTIAQGDQSQLTLAELQINGGANDGLRAEWRGVTARMVQQNVSYSGSAGALELALRGVDDWQCSANTGAGRVRREQAGKAFELPIESLALTATRSKAAWHTELSARLSEHDGLALSLSGSNTRFDQSTALQGKLRGQLRDFRWLRLLYPAVDRVTAELHSEIAIGGNWQQPALNGASTLAIDELLIDAYGIRLRPSRLRLDSSKHTAKLSGALAFPEGEIALTGHATWADGLRAHLDLSGEHIQLASAKQAKLSINPRIALEWQAQHLSLSGDIELEQAQIKLKEIPRSAVRVSEDQIVVDEGEQSAEGTNMDVNLRLTLGDKVYFQGLGIDTRLSGSLQSRYGPLQPLTTNGSIALTQGKVKLYGQELQISEGELLFVGPSTNPGIQLKAIRDLDSVVVGVRIDGTLAAPRTSFFSEPGLDDADILAYLITGKPVSELSKSEGSAVANAAVVLGVAGANRIAQKIAGVLGLKNIEIKSRVTADATRVDISGQITDDIAIGYGTDIDSGDDVLGRWVLEYKVSNNIYLEVSSGQTQSADLTYRIEFGE